MDYKEALNILDSSFSYSDYKNTYYDLLINGSIKPIELSGDERAEFYKRKKEIKERFFKQFVNEFPERLIQTFCEISYLPGITKENLSGLCNKFDEMTRPILKQHYFNERIKKLQ